MKVLVTGGAGQLGHDVMNELGVSRSKAYQILRELNHTLEQDGYKAIAGKIPKKEATQIIFVHLIWKAQLLM